MNDSECIRFQFTDYELLRFIGLTCASLTLNVRLNRSAFRVSVGSLLCTGVRLLASSLCHGPIYTSWMDCWSRLSKEVCKLYYSLMAVVVLLALRNRRRVVQ